MSGDDGQVDAAEGSYQRELHEALDVVERHFKREVGRCEAGGAHPMDLIAQLRRQVITASPPRHAAAR